MRWKIWTFAYPAERAIILFQQELLWSKSLICFGAGGGEGRFCWLRGWDGIAMGKIRINIHKRTPENKRKNALVSVHRHRRVATMTFLWLIVNYNKSKMHKSCKKKNSRLFLSAPLLTKTYLFFLLETGHCSAPLPPGRGGGALRSLKSATEWHFLSKISGLGVEYWIQFWTTL